MQEREKGDPISFSGVGLTDEDIYAAMKTVPGYIDITPGDFKELYCIAYSHAMERFARAVLAKDIMVKQVIYTLPDASIMEVAEKLSKNEISGLPVIDSAHKVLGVVSEKDILSQLGFKDRVNFMAIVTRCLEAGGCISLPVTTPTAGEIMSSPALTVLENTPLLEISSLLTKRRINRLPVTDSEGHLIGILARSDIVNAILRSGTCSLNTSER